MEEDDTPVRPEIAVMKQGLLNEKSVKDVNAVGGNESEEDKDIVWWRPQEHAGEDEEEEQKHPMKWWADEEIEDEANDEDIKDEAVNIEDKAIKDTENKEKAEKTRRGLSRDGLRGDPRKKKVDRKIMVKMNPTVHTPTRDEIEEHNRTHCPFAPWCKHCIKGRGRNSQHRSGAKHNNEDDNKEKVPRIALDYFSMSKKDEEDKIKLKKAKEIHRLFGCFPLSSP